MAQNRILDDFARLFTDAAGMAQGFRREAEGVMKSEIRTAYQVDVRYHGQGLRLSVEVNLADLQKKGLKAIADKFDAEHKRLFTFTLPREHEVVTLRAAVQGQGIKIKRTSLAKGGTDPKAAIVGKQKAFMDGKNVADFNGVAGLFVPFDESSLGHGIREFGHFDVH